MWRKRLQKDFSFTIGVSVKRDSAPSSPEEDFFLKSVLRVLLQVEIKPVSHSLIKKTLNLIEQKL